MNQDFAPWNALLWLIWEQILKNGLLHNTSSLDTVYKLSSYLELRAFDLVFFLVFQKFYLETKGINFEQKIKWAAEMLSDLSAKKHFFVEHEKSDHLARAESTNLQEVLSVGWIWRKEDIFITTWHLWPYVNTSVNWQ